MEFQEKTLTSECIYNGKVIDVLRDEVEIATGRHSYREVVKHSGGVVMVAIKEINSKKDAKILLVKQFRYPINQVVFELPAGKLEKGEDPNLACKRELEEELGLEVGNDEIKLVKSYIDKKSIREIWIVKKDVKLEELKFIDSEVSDAKFVSIGEFEQMLKQNETFNNLQYFIELYKDITK